MKFGLNVINVWDEREHVKNPAEFLLNLAVAADKVGWDGFFLWDHITWFVPRALFLRMGIDGESYQIGMRARGDVSSVAGVRALNLQLLSR